MTGEVKTCVDVVKLGRMKYNAILGMDWLSTHHAPIDCHQKRVTFKVKGISEFIFEE